MIFSFIIKTILGLAFVLLFCIAFLSKLNRSAGRQDMAQYKKDFNPYKPLSFYADSSPDEEFSGEDVEFYKHKTRTS